MVRRTGSGPANGFRSSVEATLTPWVNQISDSGGSTGRFRCTFWVLSSVFLNNLYLGTLESKQIVPRVEKTQGRFRDFLEKNQEYSLYAPTGTYHHYNKSFKRRGDTCLLTTLTPSERSELKIPEDRTLGSLLQHAGPTWMPQGFFHAQITLLSIKL